MADMSNTVSPPAFDLNTGKTAEFDFDSHSADQPTQNDQPLERPKSGTANPTDTGTY